MSRISSLKSRDLFFFFFFWSQHSIYQFFFTTHCNTTIKVQKSQDFFTFQIGRPVIYMNDLPSCATISKTLLFIDDTKIYNTACSPGDISVFQNDLNSATLWSTRYNMFFNPKKSISIQVMQKSSLISK